MTQETVVDDGRIDGIPVRTVADLERENAARLAEIERLFADTARRSFQHNTKRCVLTKGRKRIVFDSVRDACEYAGVSHTSLYTMLRRNGEAGGYKWEISGRSA